ncbi:E3 ubiquitin-protein ligase RING1-like [Lycium ferocissimum]|uniref:E3 ubiquitin-protein ligase RING1-like n=1 Tax=Lycium ferocissimum TaxID=112874 RepID=UPI002814F2BA|nr:E3 ubiquitin-protein ligase RING1-like [Lycium ferocissimum]
MDKDFDLDLALTVVGISDDTAEPPRCSTPSDDHDENQLQVVPMVNNVNGLCIVCMEGFQRGVDDHGKQLVPCGHVFHANCLTKWLSVHNSCPLCRFKVSAPGQDGFRI